MGEGGSHTGERGRAGQLDAEPTGFDDIDYLLDSDFGSIDIVPTISGTYEELAPRAVKMQTGRNSILVEAVSDLLATLTLPRREKDTDRVRQLRRIQCRQESAARHF
jgi:hypothetical protein